MPLIPRLVKPGEGRKLIVVGDTYTVLASGDDTGGAFALFHAIVPPGHGSPPHIHTREDEMFYILDGEMTFIVDGKDLVATAGAYVFGPRNIKHNFVNRSDKPVSMLFQTTPAGIEHFFAQVSQSAQDAARPPTPQYLKMLVEKARDFGIIIDVPPAH